MVLVKILFYRENTIDELNVICDKLRLVNRKDYPNDADIKEMIEKGIYYHDEDKIFEWDRIAWENETFMEYYKKDFYVLPDYSDWLEGPQDYLYIINLDNNTFDV